MRNRLYTNHSHSYVCACTNTQITPHKRDTPFEKRPTKDHSYVCANPPAIANRIDNTQIIDTPHLCIVSLIASGVVEWKGALAGKRAFWSPWCHEFVYRLLSELPPSQWGVAIIYVLSIWLLQGLLWPPKNGPIALWPSTNGATPYFLVLPGSELSITEITEYKYFSPLWPSLEFTYKSEYNTVPVNLIIESILFVWNIIFAFYYTRVRPQCDYSILGRSVCCLLSWLPHSQWGVAIICVLSIWLL